MHSVVHVRMPMMPIIFSMFSKVGTQFIIVMSNQHTNHLRFRILELRQCSLQISSMESSTSQNHCTITISLNSASGTSSLMNTTEDNELIDLQNRLQFSKTVQVRNTRIQSYDKNVCWTFFFSLWYLQVEIDILSSLVYFFYRMTIRITSK